MGYLFKCKKLSVEIFLENTPVVILEDVPEKQKFGQVAFLDCSVYEIVDARSTKHSSSPRVPSKNHSF